jgi:hypothetical protein
VSSTCFGRAARQFSADQREAHVFAFPPTTSIADSPYFHPHSFVEFSLRCQLGVLNLERVLPSRSRTGYRCFQRPRS